jgi:hypothetical protein
MAYPKFYKKAIRGNVSGRWLNPRGNEDEYLLKGDPSNPKDDIELQRIEILNAEAEKYFVRYNKEALIRGYLIPEGEPFEDASSVNAISDAEILEILKLTTPKLKARMELLTSPIPIQRLLDAAKDNNKPYKVVETIQKKLDEIKESIS